MTVEKLEESRKPERRENFTLMLLTTVGSGFREHPEGGQEASRQCGEEAGRSHAELCGGHACWPLAGAQAALHPHPSRHRPGEKAAATRAEEDPECPRPAPLAKGSCCVMWKLPRKRSWRSSLHVARSACKSCPRPRCHPDGCT